VFGWDFSNPNVNPCDEHWSGVTCSDAYYLTELNLWNNNLRGFLSDVIGQLSTLQYLDIANNQLTGIVPSSLCERDYINYLYFQGNLFQCYPACLLYPKVYNLNAGSTSICDQPTAEPTVVRTWSPSSSYDRNNISPLERQALQDLYDSTDGFKWSYTNGNGIPWNFTNPDANPCDDGWYGVTCSADFHVNYLYL